jgi:hypothetical protein
VLGAGRLNPYQAAIVAVGEVLEFYDSDKQFPAWGFGGKLGTQPVSHCFALNGRDHQPVCVSSGLDRPPGRSRLDCHMITLNSGGSCTARGSCTRIPGV